MRKVFEIDMEGHCWCAKNIESLLQEHSYVPVKVKELLTESDGYCECDRVIKPGVAVMVEDLINMKCPKCGKTIKELLEYSATPTPGKVEKFTCAKCGSKDNGNNLVLYRKVGEEEYLSHRCERCQYTWRTETVDRLEAGKVMPEKKVPFSSPENPDVLEWERIQSYNCALDDCRPLVASLLKRCEEAETKTKELLDIIEKAKKIKEPLYGQLIEAQKRVGELEAIIHQVKSKIVNAVKEVFKEDVEPVIDAKDTRIRELERKIELMHGYNETLKGEKRELEGEVERLRKEQKK